MITSNDEQQFNKWKFLEKATWKPQNFHHAKFLFVTGIGVNLRCLKISLGSWFDIDRDENSGLSSQPIFKTLLNYIHHAPTLEQLNLGETVINLSDLQKIRTALPNLKSSVLDPVHISSEERIVNTNSGVRTAESHLEAFSMNFSSRLGTDLETEAFSSTIGKWLEYIGLSCHNLQILNVRFFYTDEGTY
jgi:hypothetical protein